MTQEKPMYKSIHLLRQTFESSTTRTPQYLNFHRTFKRQITALLHPYCTAIQISKPNHFDLTGFFQVASTGLVYYIAIDDLRWNKEWMLLRRAKTFHDYTGGNNIQIPLNDDETFVRSLMHQIGVPYDDIYDVSMKGMEAQLDALIQ